MILKAGPYKFQVRSDCHVSISAIDNMLQPPHRNNMDLPLSRYLVELLSDVGNLDRQAQSCNRNTLALNNSFKLGSLPSFIASSLRASILICAVIGLGIAIGWSVHCKQGLS
ncbi:hypothetical protein GYMLUDRAFT_938573 [Collybiopsis luxurians FD-317 M1]|uniref:Uncharacterized protein n=1 Tax=Collybiopsis luxurians FD-317 M1 TaxID=944289 RepID=A0A0D0BFC4_9AGAR|nr:hypothetical protein GYMLUDRAFT_938573 [Collybiopsis luxurians FD-317 M1]